MRTLPAAFFAGALALLSISCAGVSSRVKPLCAARLNYDSAPERQVIEVVSSRYGVSKAELTAWIAAEGEWRRVFGPWPAVIGRNGFSAPGDKREGDGKTPAGIFPVGIAFGKAQQVNTGLDYRQAKDEDVWIDDSASSQYNTWVKMPVQAASYEKMRRADGLYDLGAVIGYNNAPVVAGMGSAIFIHIWRDRGKQPTTGCVALQELRLRRLLAWLNKEKEPVIALGVFGVEGQNAGK